MGYLHINNLYKPEAQGILDAREGELYALEKIHGTSAHVRWDGERVHLHHGGATADTFAACFNLADLTARCKDVFGASPATVYGEAYGGKMQGMRATYGERLRFVAFDVWYGGHLLERWLDVPEAAYAVHQLGLEFVHYARIRANLAAIDAERDRPSEQAKRNGIIEPRISEGVVLRPIRERLDGHGRRLIAKHKRPEFSERKTIPNVDPAKREMLVKAEAIATEWVTPMRLAHVLDRLGNPSELRETGRVCAAMVDDVCREASGEIRDSKAARRAIGAAAARLYKRHVEQVGLAEAA